MEIMKKENVVSFDQSISNAVVSQDTAGFTSTRGARLAWKDVWVTVKDDSGKTPSRAVLHGLTGYAEPGKTLAIMGPSGSGKSTLLDALAGRLGRRAKLKGDILLNGQRRNLSHGKVAYVTQEDTLLGTLTVRETIMYSARLRLRRRRRRRRDDNMDDAASDVKIRPEMEEDEGEGLEAMVEEVMREMGLSESADTQVGNWHSRGLSGGEKRRLSIALEILTKPSLLFLDEPTSGLDSASAFFVIATLRRLARDGRTVVASIHQPSSEVFALFDTLFLLSGGRTVYFGDRASASQHFANAGFPCPAHRNPSDHYLCAINSDFDKVKSTSLFSGDLEAFQDPFRQMSSHQITDRLVHTYHKSAYWHEARSRVDELAGRAHPTQIVSDHAACSAPTSSNYTVSHDHASFFAQTAALTGRSFMNMRRDVGYYWLRLAIYIMLTLCIGSIYFHVGTSYESVMARAACMSYITGFLTFMSIGGFPSFVEDMKVFSRERLNGHYGVISFILANFLSSLPFLALISMVSSAICYYMVGLHSGFDHFVYFMLCLLASLTVVESLMMAVASVVPNFLMGIITGAGIQGIFMLVAGFFRLPNDLPKPIWRYPMSYISFHTYAMQGMYQNDFLGLQFKVAEVSPGIVNPSLSGKFILGKMYQIDLGRSKWCNLMVLVGMAFGYRALFFAMIKISEVMRLHGISVTMIGLNIKQKMLTSIHKSFHMIIRLPCRVFKGICNSISICCCCLAAIAARRSSTADSIMQSPTYNMFAWKSGSDQIQPINSSYMTERSASSVSSRSSMDSCNNSASISTYSSSNLATDIHSNLNLTDETPPDFHVMQVHQHHHQVLLRSSSTRVLLSNSSFNALP